MNAIFKYKEQTLNSKKTIDMLRSAEQSINFVYMLIMIAFEASILIYFFINTWDDTRYYFSSVAGGALLAGIIINAVFGKKKYPWIKYANNIVMIFAVFVMCHMSDYMALVFVLITFINIFYYRPRFSAATGIVCLFMLYVGLMGVVSSVFDDYGNINYNLFGSVIKAFDYSDEITFTVLGGRSFLIIVSAVLISLSVYFSVSGRKFTIRQSELLQKNLATETEMNVARDIQEGILSTDFPDNSSYAVYADMSTAAEVGGDFYDWFLIDETHLAIVAGDVSGHGMAAAMFMTLSKTLIKVYAQAHNTADKVFEQTNRYLQQSNPAKFFVTCWLGILDLTTGVLTYSDAGHNYPVIIRADKKPEFLKTKPDFVLGRKRLVRYKENRAKLNPGDRLVLYTDGVTEAQSPGGEFFGDGRLLEALERGNVNGGAELVTELRKAVNAFENGSEHYDDATILALSFKDYLKVTPPDSKTFFLDKNSFNSVTEYITQQCLAAGCDEASVSQIEIGTSEILANIDSYVYENGGEIEVLTKCRDRRMTIVFKDNGKPFNPLLVAEPDVTMPLSKRKPGGLGIYIVKKLMSDISYSYENGQNVLTVEKDF